MKYFTFEEFEKSDTAKKLGIDNTLPKECRKNVEALVDNVLDPLREQYGKPIVVSSGYRSTELNTKIGGSRTSEHCQAAAADIIATNGNPLSELFILVLWLDLPFNQLIYEKGQWMHISYSRNGVNKRQILIYDGKSYQNVDEEYLWNIICKYPLPVVKKKDQLDYGGCNMK